MRIFNKITNITNYISSEKIKNSDISIGFVATMGCLHKGHLSLINKSKTENDLTVCSIFVNPLQFNDKKDYEKYPRNIDADTELLKSVDCDIVFIPSSDEMLPSSTEYRVQSSENSELRTPHDILPTPNSELNYDLGGLDRVMEGKFRPGHFRGVVYIVKKLFEIIKPDKAYFGLKDYQQYLIIRHIFNDKSLTPNHSPIIIGCPIVRDYDGLALSSRNIRLSSENRFIAPAIFKMLKEIKEKFNELSIVQLKQLALNQIHDMNNSSSEFRVQSSGNSEQRTTNNEQRIILDYLEIVDKDKLTPISDNNKVNAIACIALFLGEIRLIDNIFL